MADPRTISAMGALYLMLGMASVGVGAFSTVGSQLRRQVNAWWLIFPFVSLSLFLYPLGPLLLALLIGALGLRELLALRQRASVAAAVCGAALLAGLAWLMWSNAKVLMVLLPLLTVLQLLRFWRSRQADQLLLLLLLLMLSGVSFTIQFVGLPFAPHINAAWLFFLFVTTALNDVGQYIFGTLFGRDKLARSISPNKTWQGLAGGVLVSTVVAVVLGRYLELASLPALALMAPLLAVGGCCGDLMFSAAKRFLGIKDFSGLIPGHGGILDRVDSLVVTAPLLYLSIALLQQG